MKWLTGEDKALFLHLLRKIFRWVVVEERPAAEDLVFDMFLMQRVDVEGLQ